MLNVCSKKIGNKPVSFVMHFMNLNLLFYFALNVAYGILVPSSNTQKFMSKIRYLSKDV